MEIIKINPQKPEKNLIEIVVKHLKRGGILIYSTETAYGLGADARNQKAVNLIFKLKKREGRKPLSVIVSSLKEAKKFVKFSRAALVLTKKYWPGPLTLVLPRQPKTKIAKGVGTEETLALRISSHPIANALAKYLGGPIVATSANVSGHRECFSVSDIIKQFKKIPTDLLIIDGGKLRLRKMSTIIKLVDGFEVVREGVIKVRGLEGVRR